MAKPFKPGGRKGKLHDELHVPEDETIPSAISRADRRRSFLRFRAMLNTRHPEPQTEAVMRMGATR